MTEEERTQTLEEIRNERISKGEVLVKSGADIYPSTTRRTHELKNVKDNFEEYEKNSTSLIIAGRVMSVREHGGSTFIDLFDGTDELQGYVRKNEIGEDVFKLNVANLLSLPLHGQCWQKAYCQCQRNILV